VVVTQDISKLGSKIIQQDEFYKLENVLEKYDYGSYFNILEMTQF